MDSQDLFFPLLRTAPHGKQGAHLVGRDLFVFLRLAKGGISGAF